MTRDLRTLIYLLNLELREECSRTLGRPGHGLESSMQSGSSSRAIGRAAVEADAIGEQQLKRTQSGSSSRSGRDREQQLEAEANGEQQWKRMPQSGPGAAAEADTSGEQQLKRTQLGRSSSSESCPALDYARQVNKGEVAERAKRAQLLVGYMTNRPVEIT